MLPLNRNQIPKLFQSARQMDQAGRTDQALAGYRNVLAIDNSHAPAHFLTAQILYKKRDLEGAKSHLDRAVELRPSETAVWALYGRVIADLSSPAETKAFLAKAKKARIGHDALASLQKLLSKNSAKTRINIGSANPADVKRAIDLLQSGQPRAAATFAQSMRRKHPDVAIFADILAMSQAALGNSEAAEKAYKTAISLDPDYAETHSNFGRFLIEQGRFDDGMRHLKRALDLAPKMATAMVHLGVAYRRQQNPKAAMLVLNRALAQSDTSAEAHFTLGQVLVEENRPTEAIPHFDRAVGLGASQNGVMFWRAKAFSLMGRTDEALELLAELSKDAPEDAELLSQMATVHQSVGQFDRARSLLLDAIRLQPDNGLYYLNYMTAEKPKPDDPLIAQMESRVNTPDLDDLSRASFGFALAKAMEDTKQYHRVFPNLNLANALVRNAFPFDMDEVDTQVADLKARMEPVDFDAIEIAGRSDHAPIFVTGLPRSGTTLVEQILASHSSVEGGGELGHARRIWGDALFRADGSVRPWSDISDDDIVLIGEQVMAAIRAQFPGQARVTDKGVQSYSLIGPILASLPRASFVVVRRDPRDNLLSIYKNSFVAGKHRYSNNLTDLGRYYRMFDDLVRFWQDKLPGRIHTIQYEDLIANPEQETRQLIGACNLDWEDQCLQFQNTERRVSTLSMHQVRQPIYASSLKSWKRYEDDLTELFEALGDAGEDGGGNGA